jgi:hypothetical protein
MLQVDKESDGGSDVLMGLVASGLVLEAVFWGRLGGLREVVFVFISYLGESRRLEIDSTVYHWNPEY